MVILEPWKSLLMPKCNEDKNRILKVSLDYIIHPLSLFSSLAIIILSIISLQHAWMPFMTRKLLANAPPPRPDEQQPGHLLQLLPFLPINIWFIPHNWARTVYFIFVAMRYILSLWVRGRVVVGIIKNRFGNSLAHLPTVREGMYKRDLQWWMAPKGR